MQFIDALEQRLHLGFGDTGRGGLNRAVTGHGLLHGCGRYLTIAQYADEQDFVDVTEGGRIDGAACGIRAGGTGFAGIGGGYDAAYELVELSRLHHQHARSAGSGNGGALCLGLLHVDGGFGRVAASAFGFYATALSGDEAKLCRV